ncbi:MAG: phosphopyruvate hydratase [bacterium]
MKIQKITAREILDSRGFPTVECCLELGDEGSHNRKVWSSVPSGASVGQFEAIELRDGDMSRFGGKGVLKAIYNIEQVIAPGLIGKAPDILTTDKYLIELDGTENKSKLGANALLAVSMAVARAQALCANQPLFKLLNDVFCKRACKSAHPAVPGVASREAWEFVEGALVMPTCMYNIINGGAHADSGITFQEFMIMPKNQKTVADSVRIASTVYHELKKILKEAGYSTNIGDEGGFAPRILGNGLEKELTALKLLVKAIKQAGFSEKEVVLCLDVAASQFYDNKKQVYIIDGKPMQPKELVAFYVKLVAEFPLYSIEDGMSEDDAVGWQLLTKELGHKVQIVGDDIFVTNKSRIQAGINDKIANSVLIKLNQIGTVTETWQAIKLSKDNNYTTVVSHRSGETNDSFIADLVVGCAAGQIKAGAPARGERVAKYNRLMEIEKSL